MRALSTAHRDLTVLLTVPTLVPTRTPDLLYCNQPISTYMYTIHPRTRTRTILLATVPQVEFYFPNGDLDLILTPGNLFGYVDCQLGKKRGKLAKVH